ncbi:MAG: hypothetical protein VX874_05360 [Pseudomonadota bacterium]|nr:hypothetical protein [Pseudomonadota bacterium]
MTTLRFLALTSSTALALSACTNGITANGVGLKESFDAYLAALAANADFVTSDPSVLPTSGTATYEGGAYFDLTPNGSTQGDLIASRMTANVTYTTNDWGLTAQLTDASRFGLAEDEYEGFGDAIAGRSDIDTFELFADSFRDVEPLEGDVTLSVQDVPVGTADFTTQMRGTLTGPTSTVEIDAPVYGFFVGPDAEGLRMTGTNFGNLELEVNGQDYSAYFDARGVRQD